MQGSYVNCSATVFHVLYSGLYHKTCKNYFVHVLYFTCHFLIVYKALIHFVPSKFSSYFYVNYAHIISYMCITIATARPSWMVAWKQWMNHSQNV